jgi:hypothetical protein
LSEEIIDRRKRSGKQGILPVSFANKVTSLTAAKTTPEKGINEKYPDTGTDYPVSGSAGKLMQVNIL